MGKGWGISVRYGRNMGEIWGKDGRKDRRNARKMDGKIQHVSPFIDWEH